MNVLALVYKFCVALVEIFYYFLIYLDNHTID